MRHASHVGGEMGEKGYPDHVRSSVVAVKGADANHVAVSTMNPRHLTPFFRIFYLHVPWMKSLLVRTSNNACASFAGASIPQLFTCTPGSTTT